MSTTPEEMHFLSCEAYRLGAEKGEAAASWYFDGNTTRETYEAVLRGLAEGDPAIYDTFPSAPLSGEWALGLTPHDLLRELGVDDDDDAADEYLSMFEDGYGVAVADEIERMAREALASEPEPDATQRDYARLMAARFTQRTREDGTGYVTLTDGADEWMRELVRFAHNDMLPDDWRYNAIAAAVEFVADEEDYEDRADEWADDMVDADWQAILDWLGSHAVRAEYVNEARDEFGDAGESLYDELARGQFLEAREVFALVVRALDTLC